MDFKEMYDSWLADNTGLQSAVNNSYADFTVKKKGKGITTQDISSPFFKRGSFCTFDYIDVKMAQRVLTDETVPFFDGHPFVFALEHDKQYQYGLNLNVLPMQARIRLFTILFKFHWDEIQYNMEHDYNQWRELSHIDSKNVARLIGMKSDIAINKYDMSIIRKGKAIEWQSAVQASTLYMKHNIIFNKKKNMNLQTIWSIVF